MSIFRKIFAITAVLGLPVVALTACDSNENATGRVRVLLTDAPIDSIVEAHVSVERIELLGAEGGTILLSDTEESFDLLTLQNGVTATLADIEVPEGEYNQLRLIIDENAEVVFEDASTQQLKVPSGTQTGIKILFPTFEIDDVNDLVVLTVDFDASRSFVEAGQSGQILFKPVIKPKAIVVNGEEEILSETNEEADSTSSE